MKKSRKSYFKSRFSHVYVEEEAFEFPATKRVLDSLTGAVVVPIGNYKRFFNRPRQHFQMQKKSPKIVLAVKKPPFIYRASDLCQNYGNNNFIYTMPALNCIYNCDYCYLQGMFNSANLVLFVNHSDFFFAAEEAAKVRVSMEKPLLISISYDTDLLAIEKYTGYCAKWITFARNAVDVEIEIRTKSASFGAIADIEPTGKVVLAWSLAPPSVSKRYERGAPSSKKRLEAAAEAASRGWNVRLCFDPVIPLPDWKRDYRKIVDETFEMIPAERITDVAVGPFRMGDEHFKRARKNRFDCDLYIPGGGDRGDEISKFMFEVFCQHIPQSKIHCFL